jgi:hypothetical protein
MGGTRRDYRGGEGGSGWVSLGTAFVWKCHMNRRPCRMLVLHRSLALYRDLLEKKKICSLQDRVKLGFVQPYGWWGWARVLKL